MRQEGVEDVDLHKVNDIMFHSNSKNQIHSTVLMYVEQYYKF